MKRPIILYPIFFAFWIVLSSYVPYVKMGEVEFGDILRALVFTPVLMLSVWAFFSLALKNWKLGALLGWVTVGLFFTYQAQVDYLWQFLHSDRQVLTIMLFVMVWAVACVMVYYLKNSLDSTTKILNVVGGSLFVVQLVTLLGIHMMSFQVTTTESHASVSEMLPQHFDAGVPSSHINNAGSDGTYPDIYYIVLDGYGRDDILKNMYDYDNTPFIHGLIDRGFYVAQKSRSNYAQTVLSLSSSLNFQYLEKLPEKFGKDSENQSPLRELIQDNAIMALLKNRGYETVAFSTGISFTELRSADSYIVTEGTLSEWESFYLMRTPIPTVLEELFGYSLYDVHKTRLTSMMNQLPTIATQESPQFVLAHFVAPHPPFVLGQQDRQWLIENDFSFRDGSEFRYHYKISSQEYISRYRAQLDVLNSMIQKAIDGILSHSGRRSIIIVQSDHGPGAYLDWQDPTRTVMKERMSILNAYYFPEGPVDELYESISPVNTFRLILNRYFDVNIPLLEDESYFSTMSRPYDFIRVTDMIAFEAWEEKAQAFESLIYQ